MFVSKPFSFEKISDYDKWSNFRAAVGLPILKTWIFRAQR